MHKLLLIMIFVSQSCFSENINEHCTGEMLEQHSYMVGAGITSNVQYPKLALRRGWQGDGTAELTFTEGAKTTRRVIRSTGHEVLDFEILRAIDKTELPKLLCKHEAKVIHLIVPIKFRL